MSEKKTTRADVARPFRSYAALSMWQTEPITVEYDATLRQVSIFQGHAYLVYSVEAWFAITQAVEQVLPVPLADLVADREELPA